MIQEKRDLSGADRERPPPGVQYHSFIQAQPKTEIAQASAVPHYLIPFSWFQKFIAYTKDGSDTKPPMLDLQEMEMFKEGRELKSNLKSGRDIHILQVNQWTLIQSWYGQEDEQCVRHSYKLPEGQYVLEFRPTDFYFSLYTPPSSFTEVQRISMYKYKDVEGLYEKARYAFDISPSHQLRFWHTTASAGLTNLNNAREAITKTYDRVSIGTVTDGSTSFIIETRKNAAEKWQLEGCKKAQIARRRPLGTKGLNNLGNTCYMASALQCLTHVKEFSEYFLSKFYRTELNPDNPLGYGGRVATSFAKLLEQLYEDDNSKAVAPRDLKTILGNINQSFAGYQQQDSQELLAFLLDALHEDLNRIVKKPATERPDIGDVSDDELLKLGEQAWETHKRRNDSVVVDLFQGIYKSTLVCPICWHVSITFDPFSDLSLPLPFRSYWNHDIHYIPLSGSIVKISVEFEQNASIGQLISYLAKRFNVNTNMIAGAEVWKHRFYKVYENYMPVTTIEKSDEAFFYELGHQDPRCDKVSTSLWIPVYTNKRMRGSERAEECAVPFPLILTEEESRSITTIQAKLLHSYSQFTTSQDLLSSVDDSHLATKNCSAIETAEVFQEKHQPSLTTPFEIKVGPHKIGASFYGGREPVPLLTRVSKFDVARADIQNTSRCNTLKDDLPSYDTALSQDAPSEQSDIKQIEAAPIAFSKTENEARAFDGDDDDMGMNDASDDELTQPQTFGDEFVGRLVSSQEQVSQSAVDALPTPLSTPTTPIDENLTDAALSDASTGIALVSAKDALYCEWPEAAYDEIFSTEKDTIGGRSLWQEYDHQVDEEMDARRANRESSKHNTRSLEDCLDEFSKEEPLDAENTWYCPKCKEHQRANKTFELWRTGDILVFHLKRFSNSRSLADKIDAEIEFPVRGLNMNERLGERRLRVQKGATDLEDSIYDLTGVVNHYGGLGGGHYTAFAQTFSADGYEDFHNFNGQICPKPIVRVLLMLLRLFCKSYGCRQPCLFFGLPVVLSPALGKRTARW